MRLNSDKRRVFYAFVLVLIFFVLNAYPMHAQTSPPKPAKKTAEPPPSAKPQSGASDQPEASPDSKSKKKSDGLRLSSEDIQEVRQDSKGIVLLLFGSISAFALVIALIVFCVAAGSFPLWLGSKIFRIRKATYLKAIGCSFASFMASWFLGFGTYTLGYAMLKQAEKMSMIPMLRYVALGLAAFGALVATKTVYSIDSNKKALYIWLPYILLVGGLTYLWYWLRIQIT